METPLRAEAEEKNIPMEEIETWIRQRIDTLFDHLRFCERCQQIRDAIKDFGPVFRTTSPDPRVFTGQTGNVSDGELPQEQIDRVA